MFWIDIRDYQHICAWLYRRNKVFSSSIKICILEIINFIFTLNIFCSHYIASFIFYIFFLCLIPSIRQPLTRIIYGCFLIACPIFIKWGIVKNLFPNAVRTLCILGYINHCVCLSDGQINSILAYRFRCNINLIIWYCAVGSIINIQRLIFPATTIIYRLVTRKYNSVLSKFTIADKFLILLYCSVFIIFKFSVFIFFRIALLIKFYLGNLKFKYRFIVLCFILFIIRNTPACLLIKFACCQLCIASGLKEVVCYILKNVCYGLTICILCVCKCRFNIDRYRIYCNRNIGLDNIIFIIFFPIRTFFISACSICVG